MLDWLATRLPARIAGLYTRVFQRFSKPIGITPLVGQQTLRLWQAAQLCPRAGLLADLACGHEEPDRTAIGIGDSMHLGVLAALRAVDQTAPLVAWPPI